MLLMPVMLSTLLEQQTYKITPLLLLLPLQAPAVKLLPLLSPLERQQQQQQLVVVVVVLLLCQQLLPVCPPGLRPSQEGNAYTPFRCCCSNGSQPAR